MSEERITNETTGGQKGKKPEDMALLPFDVLMQDVAPLYHFGAKKYAAHNWRKGYDWSLSFGAMQRHAAMFWHGEDMDEETECAHLASVIFHASALLYFMRHHRELDDRPPASMGAIIEAAVPEALRGTASCPAHERRPRLETREIPMPPYQVDFYPGEELG